MLDFLFLLRFVMVLKSGLNLIIFVFCVYDLKLLMIIDLMNIVGKYDYY